MKRMKILILILLFSRLSAYCPQDKTLTIFEAPVIAPYEPIWNATCAVETNFDADAIGDLIYEEYSYGIVQIRRSRLMDYYLQTGIWYDVVEMLNPVKAKKVFMHYAMQIHYADAERIAREWNGGPKGMKKKTTIKYYKKILAVLK